MSLSFSYGISNSFLISGMIHRVYIQPDDVSSQAAILLVLTIVCRTIVSTKLCCFQAKTGLGLMKSNILVKFGQRVRQERTKKGLSQEELADIAGVHRTYIGMIERAEKNITLENIEKIARALSMKPEELLRFDTK